MIHICFLLLAGLALFQPCQGSFLAAPRVQWTYRLPGSGTLAGRGPRNGNEVLASPDGTMLFVTADDGSLHFVMVNDLTNSFVFEPATIPGTYTECRSGVSLVYDPITQDVDYVVYAVLDVPVKAGILYDGADYDPTRTSTLSRLLAINLDGTLRYSVPLNGAVVGKPIVGKDRIYVVHNVPNYIGTSPTRGKVSIVLMDANPPTVTASVSPPNQHGPFGPPAGASVTLQGREQDILVVAETWDGGYSTTQGMVHLLRRSSVYDAFDGQGNDAYELKLVSDWAMASFARPSVKADATEIFVGASIARLSGWTGEGSMSEVVSGNQYNVAASWTVDLEANKGNASQPLMVAPVLSSDEKLIYQVGASTQMYCIDAQTGTAVWTSDGALRGAVLAEPRLSEVNPDEPKVYVIEAMKGKVRQHDALTGDIDWSIDCQSVSGNPCHDAVEADYSVAPGGATLYYGDIFGRIVALEVADFTTSSPTTSSPSARPTVTPTVKPTAKPTEIEEEEEVVIPITTPPAEPVERTSSPTTAPVVPATPAPVPQPKPEPSIDSVPYEEDKTTGAPTQEDDDEDWDADDDADGDLEEPGVITVVDVSSQGTDTSDSEFASSAAIDGDESDPDSFFSNDIMIILVAVCGGLALAIIVLIIAQKARTMKNNKSKPTDHMLVSPEDDGKDWNSAQDEYEEACRKNEEETLREIVGLAAQTPAKQVKKNPKKQKKMSPMTPSTLASIEESPAENELSFVSDATPEAKPKNLKESFDASFAADKGMEVTLGQSQIHKDTKEPLDSGGVAKDANKNVDPDGPARLSSVEVVASDVARSKQKQAQRAMSPHPVSEPLAVDGAANDLMSVDGSLYLDDDSKFDVASLSQFSVASTTDGASTENYPKGQIRYEAAHSSTPGDHYMQPPRVASPLLNRSLSPEVADYHRRNQNPMQPDPMTPNNAYVGKDATSPLSTSPMTPPTADSSHEKEVRKPQSVRLGRGRDPEQSRARTPSPPKPPVEEEDDQPEDAWNSFLSELAKAERDFFNPSFKKKKKGKQERPQSPPPPPPPDYPPPGSATQGKGPPPPPPPPPDPPMKKRLV